MPFFGEATIQADNIGLNNKKDGNNRPFFGGVMRDESRYSHFPKTRGKLIGNLLNKVFYSIGYLSGFWATMMRRAVIKLFCWDSGCVFATTSHKSSGIFARVTLICTGSTFKIIFSKI